MVIAHINELADSYSMQLELYLTLHEMTLKLSELPLETDDTLEALQFYIEQRENLLHKIKAKQECIQASLAAVAGELHCEQTPKNILKKYPCHQTKLIVQKFEEIQVILKKILSLDGSYCKDLKKKKNTLQQEAGKLQGAQRARRTYQASPRQSAGVFLDKKKY